MVATPIRTQSKPSRIDVNALRTNQALIVSLVLIAFVLGTGNGGAWIVAAVAVSLAIGATRPGYGPFQLLYKRLITPAGILHPKPESGEAAPHRFAQAMGAAFLAIAAILLFAEVTTLGWVLGALVVALALTNLVFGFCAGCFIFYQLRKAGLGA